MYSASTDRPQPPPNAGNIVRFGVIGFIALLIVLVVGKPAVALYMNIGEFDDQFTRPLFYSLVSAVILGIIALVRVNIVSRSSIFWYAISTLITFASSAQNQNIQNIQAYRKYKLGRISFVVWQITKILLFGAFFTNILFGFAAMEFIGGDYLGIENIAQLFTLPFVTPPADTAYGTDIVVPMICVTFAYTTCAWGNWTAIAIIPWSAPHTRNTYLVHTRRIKCTKLSKVFS